MSATPIMDFRMTHKVKCESCQHRGFTLFMSLNLRILYLYCNNCKYIGKLYFDDREIGFEEEELEEFEVLFKFEDEEGGEDE